MAAEGLLRLLEGVRKERRASRVKRTTNFMVDVIIDILVDSLDWTGG